MTAAAPDSVLRGLARESRAYAAARPNAEPGDRIFVTLLSLNFMLLAFFVVLGTASSYDQPRAASVAKSVRIVFATPGADDDATSPIHLTARQALQAGVSEAFADVLPLAQRTTGDNGDRVDVSLPATTFATSGERTRDAMLDGIARLLRAPPAGIRYELVLDGPADTANLADGLIARGVSSQALMLGNDAAQSDAFQFSFLLLDGDDATLFSRLVSHGAP